MKITLQEVSEALARAGVTGKPAELTINHLQEVIKELEEEKDQQNPTPKVKNEFGVLILDEHGDIWIGTKNLIRYPQDAADLAACPLNVDRYKN